MCAVPYSGKCLVNHTCYLFAEPEGQLLSIQGSIPNDVAASIERVLQVLRMRTSESKVKSVMLHFPRHFLEMDLSLFLIGYLCTRNDLFYDSWSILRMPHL